MKINPPFRADHVGSLLRPRALLAARDRFRQGEISKDQLREAEDRSIRDVVTKQESVGLVTTKVGTLEPWRELTDRIQQTSRHVPLERLCLSPQCGFSSTVEGNDIIDDQQWAKLERVVATARDVWGH